MKANEKNLTSTSTLCSPDYETKAQVAHRLGISERTVDNMMKKRLLPFIKLTSKIVRFPKAEVDAYLAANFFIKGRTHEGDDK